MAEISVQRSNWRQWSGFAPTWERIHNMCRDASFFLSRAWVDCWLATFGEDLNPDILAFVERLEQASDSEGEDGPAALPSGDILASEFQRFLRQRGREGK